MFLLFISFLFVSSISTIVLPLTNEQQQAVLSAQQDRDSWGETFAKEDAIDQELLTLDSTKRTDGLKRILRASSEDEAEKKLKKHFALSKTAGYKAEKTDRWLRKGAPQKKDNGDAIDTTRSGFDIAQSGAGLTIYQMIDALIAQDEAMKLAEGLEGKTPHEVARGFEDNAQTNPLGGYITPNKISQAIRPLSKLAYSGVPFAHEVTQNKLIKNTYGTWGAKVFPKQSAAAKTLGAANLTGVIADAAHNLINRKNNRLTAEEAALLSYLNRREGVPTDITDYKKFMKRSTRARQLINILGQGAVPIAMAALLKKEHKPSAAYVGNAAGIADSVLSMIERHKTRSLIKKIKSIAPTIKRELEATPPTQKEIDQNKQNATPFDMDDFDLGF